MTNDAAHDAPGQSDMQASPEAIDDALSRLTPHDLAVIAGTPACLQTDMAAPGAIVADHPCPCGADDGLWCSLPGCPYPRPEA